MLAGMKRIEVGDAIRAEDDGLADDELLALVSARGLDDPGIALCPVIAVARNQPDAIRRLVAPSSDSRRI
jgi:hypothetical protein